jgi:hypothetical protein
MTFEVLAVVLLKIQVFLDVTLCLLEVSKRLSGFVFKVQQTSPLDRPEMIDPEGTGIKIVQNFANYLATDTA